MVRIRLAHHAPLAAFPLSVARTRSGAFVGFVMRLVANHKPLHELYSPGPRKHHFPHADYRFLVRTATNISRAVASVHKSGCVIGDINHSGVLISPKALVSLIDADSFQVTADAKSYLCRVGVPEYTPPELQGKALANIVRTPNHDAFGLAVVIFQLLFMGRHPFVGTVRRGEIPPLHEAIRDYRFVYTDERDVGMDQPPGTPALSDFPAAISAAFDASFGKNSAIQRPTAASWVHALEELEKALVQCGDNALHYAPRDASTCPWCEMEQQLGTFLFLPFVPHDGPALAPFDPGAGGFNIDQIWARIASLEYPTRATLQPRTATAKPSPSAEARASLLETHGSVWPRVIAGGIAIVIFFAAVQAWILWVPLGLWALFSSSSDSRMDGERFRKKYLEAEENWNRELEDWYRRCGVDDLESALKELRESRDSYIGLAAEERAKIDAYLSERKSRQLHAYLDGFDIQHAKIKGIGTAKLAALSSYGIDTAADISLPKLLQVPGFGPTTSTPLLDWRAQHEKRFTFRQSPTPADAQELAKIRSAVEAKASMLRRKLLGGSNNLVNLLARVKRAAANSDPAIDRAQSVRAQARVDLEYLQLGVPTAGAGSSSLSSSARSAPATIPTRTTSTPSCPRCRSGMVWRIARRGRNAGNGFWGCSRYPRCRGTRN